MNGVVPVVVVVGDHAVPTAVVRFKRVVGPANASIGTGNNDGLPGESQGPHLRRVSVIDARLDCGWCLRLRYFHRSRLRQVVVDTWIAFYSRHVGTRGQRIGHLPCSPHQDCVNNVEGLMFDGAVAQPLQDWALRGLALVQQTVIDVAALLSLGLQIGRTAQVGLISEHNEKFGLLPVCSMFYHPRRDLVRRSESGRWWISLT